MSDYQYDLNPVDSIVADAEGEPGKRTFFLQARAGRQIVTVTLEKQEVVNLAQSLLQLLIELEEKYPDLPPAPRGRRTLYPDLPIDPAFRVMQLIVGYDDDDDKIWIIAKAMAIGEDGTVVDPDDDAVPTARFICSRAQVRAFCEHALEVAKQGRPICPLCNRPIDRSGHFCPRSDGHRMPIVL